MKRIHMILLFASSTLVACQAKFDECMDTELPRAEALTGLEAEREVERQLVELRELDYLSTELSKGMQPFRLENISTEFMKARRWPCGDYNASDSFKECVSEYEKLLEEKGEEWSKTPHGKLYLEREIAEYRRVGLELGVSIANRDELNEFFDTLDELYDTVLEPRSSIYQCYVDPECDEHVRDGSLADAAIRREAIHQAMLENAKVISELVEAAQQLATVTCNNKGFYE